MRQTRREGGKGQMKKSERGRSSWRRDLGARNHGAALGGRSLKHDRLSRNRKEAGGCADPNPSHHPALSRHPARITPPEERRGRYPAGPAHRGSRRAERQRHCPIESILFPDANAQNVAVQERHRRRTAPMASTLTGPRRHP